MIASEEEPYRGRFLARVTDDMRAQIDGASRMGWVPLALHVKLADILLETFGTVRAHDYYRRAFGRALMGPILGPLVRTGTYVLGVSFASFVRWSSKGYDASYRNAGRLTGEVLEPGRARLVFQDLPAICTVSDSWMMSPQGSAYGLYDFLHLDGVVRLDTRARASGRMVLELEWAERKRTSG